MPLLGASSKTGPDYFHCSWYLSVFYGKVLLLKIPHFRIIKHGETNRPDVEALPLSAGTQSAMHATTEEK